MRKCQRCKEFLMLFFLIFLFFLYYLVFGYSLRGYWFDLSPLYIYPLSFLSLLNILIITWFGTMEYFLRFLIGTFYFVICITGIAYIFLYKYLNIIIQIKSKRIENLRKEQFIIFYFLVARDVKKGVKRKNIIRKIFLFQLK